MLSKLLSPLSSGNFMDGFHEVHWITRQELSRWVIAHYYEIAEAALHALGLVRGAPPPRPSSGADRVFCIYLAMQIDPHPTDVSPLGIVTCQTRTIEAHSRLHARTGFPSIMLLRDPAPGASKAYLDAKRSGKRVLRIYIYNDPVLCELLIPAPSRAVTSRLTFNPDWENSLKALASTTFRERHLFSFPERTRPPPEYTLPQEPRRRLAEWSLFYEAILYVAAFAFLDLSRLPFNGDYHYLAIQLKKRSDGFLSRNFLAFFYDVDGIERIPYGGINSWLEARGCDISGTELDYNNSNIPRWVAEEGRDPFDWQRMPIVICSPNENSEQESLAFHYYMDWYKQRDVPAGSWIRRLSAADAKRLLEEYVHRGFYIDKDDCLDEDPPTHKYNAFGFIHME